MTFQKTNTTPELWQLTKKWLLLLGNQPNTKFCREEITTHPDYPAMTAVTDFLDAGNMAYSAVQADASYIHEFNYPLLAHIKKPGQEYLHIISNANEWDKQKEISQHWSGIVLFPEKNTTWQNKQNSNYQKEALSGKVVVVLLFVAASGLLIASSMQQINTATIVFGLLSLFGLVVSIFLLGTELGYQSQLVKQVCGAVSGGGCENVLKSKYAKGMFGITPADASVLYFATQFIFYLSRSYFPYFLNFLLLLALAGVAIAAWSIYTQAIQLKQWCVLCLGVVVVLILQTTITLFISDFTLLQTVSLQPLLFFILLVSLLAVVLLPVKTLIKKDKANQQKLAELKNWKTDMWLFITQWQQEKIIDTTIWDKDILLGNPDAPILITVACNPYCGPCAKAHLQLDELLQQFSGKIKILVRFLFNVNNEKDDRTIVVKAILQNAESLADNTALQKMITDWFASMDYNKWVACWKPDNTTNVDYRMQQHNKWVEVSNIKFTPTFFINGRGLPGRYGLMDVKLLLPELKEILTKETVK